MLYFTDEDMLKRAQFLAFICLGGIDEGFDYSKEREKLAWIGAKRRELFYQGGFLSESDAREFMGTAS